MAAPPQSIRALKTEPVLEICWSSGQTEKLPFRFLRGRCPCANCVNELTGERMVGPEGVDQEVHPDSMGFSGNYALTINWSDGHHTGLYTWDYLKELGHEAGQNTGQS